MIHLTPEQRHSLRDSATPICALDPETRKEYVIMERDAFEKIKRVLDVDEIDPSHFEFEEIDVTVDVPREL
ncbi:MAG: hypothetical protein WD894_03820 [Pirellulales bacterium]